jgi:DNA-binding NarL/FixJ family response regulator
MIRLVIADDHAIMRGGLKQIMATTGDIAVVGEAADAPETLALVRTLEFDLLLLDLLMPGSSGSELIRLVRQTRENLPILVLSMSNERQIVSRAIQAGAAGYVTKDTHPEVLLSAIRRVAGGGRFVDPSLVESIVFKPDDRNLQPHELLSYREFQIMQLLVEGQPVGDIAAALHLSPKTVSTYKLRLMQKLNIDSMAGLVHYAVEHGLVGNIKPI